MNVVAPFWLFRAGIVKLASAVLPVHSCGLVFLVRKPTDRASMRSVAAMACVNFGRSSITSGLRRSKPPL